LDLSCSLEFRSTYRSNSQIARVLTENWFAGQMYCPACDSGTLVPSPNNCPGIDFTCPKCALSAQLKSRRTALTNRIVDAGYDAMIRAIRSERAPNLFLLRYSQAWSIIDLLLIPSFFFTESVIQKRNPLSPLARRAGWVGCNILLGNIPKDGRIPVVARGVATNPSQVRETYLRLQPFRSISMSARGWTLDILNVLRKLGKKDLSLSDFYQFERHLQDLHPNNKNVRPKIRQQLQVLRDLGYVAFEGDGHYRVLR
jgi:type II restriction enzyme